MKSEIIMILLVLTAMIVPVCTADDIFDKEGKDPLVVGDTIFGWLYKVLVMILAGGWIIVGLYMVKDHLKSSGGSDSSQRGAAGTRLTKGLILATIAIVCGPFIINMFL